MHNHCVGTNCPDIHFLRDLHYSCCALRNLPGRSRDGLCYGILFGHTWHCCNVTILNERYLAQGAGTAGLATGRADAGGLSSSDRMVEGQLIGTEKKGLYSTWILICGFSALSYRVRRYHYEGIGWNICPPEIQYSYYY
jgi:hypothetical protein